MGIITVGAILGVIYGFYMLSYTKCSVNETGGRIRGTFGKMRKFK